MALSGTTWTSRAKPPRRSEATPPATRTTISRSSPSVVAGTNRQTPMLSQMPILFESVVVFVHFPSACQCEWARRRIDSIDVSSGTKSRRPRLTRPSPCSAESSLARASKIIHPQAPSLKVTDMIVLYVVQSAGFSNLFHTTSIDEVKSADMGWEARGLKLQTILERPGSLQQCANKHGHSTLPWRVKVIHLQRMSVKMVLLGCGSTRLCSAIAVAGCGSPRLWLCLAVALLGCGSNLLKLVYFAMILRW